MFRKNVEILSFRQIAILPILLFVPTMLAIVLLPATKISNVVGIFFHIATFFLVARMPAPEWAKAAGYGWLALDILCAVMLINDVPHPIAWPVRLAGHVLEGLWLLPVSLLCAPLSLRVLGVVIGLWVATYSFFGTALPATVLAPAGVLTCVWFGLLAWHYKRTPV